MEQEIEAPSTRSIGIKYGIISGLLGIIFFIVVDVTGNAGNQSISWLGLIITIAVMVLAHREFKNNGDGFMEYKQGLGIGLWQGVIGSAISSIFTFIYVIAINTEYIDMLKEQQRFNMEEQGMSDAQIEQAMDISGIFMSPGALLGFGLFFGILFTLIIALIVSAITKKSRPELI